MTAFVPTDIPSNINTLEKLVAWGALALERCNPSLKVLEVRGADPQRVAATTTFTADDGSYRMIARLSFEIAQNYAENPAKFWQNILEFDDVALPSAYKSN